MTPAVVTPKAQRTALVAVDVQRDFLPGGALGVPHGNAVVAPLLRLAELCPVVVATRDFHPRDHVSFNDRGGPWPPHCIAGTPGALIHPAVDAVAQAVISKGLEREREAYSGFDGTWLEHLLRSLGIRDVIIGGLATDYCVRATAVAAVAAGFATTVAVDAVRAVDVQAGDGDRALAAMREAGVSLAETGALVATAAS